MIAWLLRHPWIVAIIALLGIVLYLDQSRARWMRAAIDARMREEAAQFEARLKPLLDRAAQLGVQLDRKVREAEVLSRELAQLKADVGRLRAEAGRKAQEVQNLRAVNEALGGRLQALGQVSATALQEIEAEQTLEEIARGLRR